MTAWSLLESSQIDPKVWDQWILDQAQGSIHQTQAWKNLQTQIPGRQTVLGWCLVDKKKNILAATWCIRMHTGLGKYHWWYSPRGPVWSDHCPPAAVTYFLEQITAKLAADQGIFWRFDPLISLKEKNNWPLIGRTATQNYQPSDTLMLDLRSGEDILLQQMKRKGRYNINLARKKGIKIELFSGNKITSCMINDFWRLHQQTTSRDGFYGHDESYYHLFCQKLKSYVWLCFATTADGHRIASAIMTICQQRAIYYFGSSSSNPEHRSLMAPYLLQWHMIQTAKKKHCLTYDFLGIAPAHQTKHVYAGISEFKWKFGGYRQTYIPGREIILRPSIYLLYRLGKNIQSLRRQLR